MMRRAFLCVSIDCECDKGAGWRTQRPMAFAGVSEGIVARLQPLFRAHGAKATYLLSPEVIRDAKSAEALASIQGSCELGAHLHGEYAEPGAHEPDKTQDFQRDYPHDVEEKKLTYLTELFTRTFGKPPRSFRAGRFGLGESSLGILEDLGYAVDSSVTPGMDWAEAGAPGLSFLGAPTQPYHPDRKDPARPGGSTLLEVPLTILPRALSRLPVLGRLLEPRWLRPSRGTAASLIEIAREEIERANAGKSPVILNAMFHNVEVVAGASPYAASDDEARAILDRLGALLAFAEREAIAVIGLSDVPGVLA